MTSTNSKKIVHIRLGISTELHTRLQALVSHHGELSHLLRRGVELVCIEEETRRAQVYSSAKKKGS